MPRAQPEASREAAVAGAADRAAWQGAAELGIDLTAAITAALGDGSLSAMSASVVYLHYFLGLSMEEIGDALKLSYDQVRRYHKKALRAIRSTGLLDGYSGTGKG